jgi:hypothetical protein
MYFMPASNSASSASLVWKKSSVNAHSVTSRITNGTPSTGAMSSHIANIREQNGPGAAYVHASVSEARSGSCLSAYSWAIMPPIETPIRWNRSMPSASTSAFVSSASSSDVYGPAGLLVAPTPRLSNVSTRYPASSSAGVWYAHVSFSSARPLTSTTVSGPSPSSV